MQGTKCGRGSEDKEGVKGVKEWDPPTHEVGSMTNQRGRWRVKGGEGQTPGHPRGPQGSQEGQQAETAQEW